LRRALWFLFGPAGWKSDGNVPRRNLPGLPVPNHHPDQVGSRLDLEVGAQRNSEFTFLLQFLVGQAQIEEFFFCGHEFSVGVKKS